LPRLIPGLFQTAADHVQLFRFRIRAARSESGRLDFNGRDIGELSADRRRLIGIGHVPQGDLLFPDLSVEENLEAGAYTSWRERNTRKAEIFGLFAELASRRNSSAATLSGGVRRMLAISRAVTRLLPSEPMYISRLISFVRNKRLPTPCRRIQASVDTSGVVVPGAYVSLPPAGGTLNFFPSRRHTVLPKIQLRQAR
jgi:hypothetical protein